MRSNHSMIRIRGSYALAIMFKDYPEKFMWPAKTARWYSV